MAVLFLPIRISFSQSIAAGAGLVTQVTYTCPAGKRAEVHGIWLQMNANTATLGTGLTRAVVGAVVVLSCLNLSVNGTTVALGMVYDLSAGETAILQTTGGAAQPITMSGSVYIREYQ